MSADFRLAVAAFRGHCDGVDAAVAAGAHVNSPLSADDHDAVLTEVSCARECSPGTPFLYAVAGGHVDAAKHLVAAHSAVPQVVSTDDDNGAVMWAAMYGRLDMLKYLVGRDVGLSLVESNDFGSTAAHYLALGGFVDAMRWVAKKTLASVFFAIPNSEDTTPIHWAAHNDQPAALEYLARDIGVDVNVEDELGATPLHMACLHGGREAAAWFFSTGLARPDARASNGGTPLHSACWGGHAAIVRDLLAAGCDPLALDAFGNTPLMWAAMKNKTEVIHTLLSACDPSMALVVAKNGNLPLSQCRGTLAAAALLAHCPHPASAKHDADEAVALALTRCRQRFLQWIDGKPFVGADDLLHFPAKKPLPLLHTLSATLSRPRLECIELLAHVWACRGSTAVTRHPADSLEGTLRLRRVCRVRDAGERPSEAVEPFGQAVIAFL